MPPEFFIHGEDANGKTSFYDPCPPKWSKTYDPYLNPVVAEFQEIADLLRGLHEETAKLKKVVTSLTAIAVFFLIHHTRRSR